MSLPSLLLSSIAERPYVFAFLLAFLVAGGLQLGARRTLTFLVVGYVVAFAAEYASTHGSFPFGHYVYTGATRDRELYLANVPCFDSLSFVFLAYASYSMALFFCLPRAAGPGRLALAHDPDVRQSPRVLFLAAFLMMYLDLVIDPIAVRGSEWFLGRIFYYPSPGCFFGVPLANFLGWFVVALVIVGAAQCLDIAWLRVAPEPPARRTLAWPRCLLGPLLWWGILGFNLAIACVLRDPARPETLLFPLVAGLLHAPILVFFALRLAAETLSVPAVSAL